MKQTLPDQQKFATNRFVISFATILPRVTRGLSCRLCAAGLFGILVSVASVPPRAAAQNRNIDPPSAAALMPSQNREFVVEFMTTTLIREAALSAKEAGTIKAIRVTPGALVSEGQLLAELDDERQTLAIRAAELNLAIARTNAEDQLAIESARGQIREAEQARTRLEIAAKISGIMATSDVGIRLAEKSRELAEFELDRARKAREAFTSSVSAAELNRLQVGYDQRVLEIQKSREDHSVSALRPLADQAAVAEQSETIERSRLLLAQKERDQSVAKLNRDVAANDLELAKLQLERRHLTAPFAGMVVATTKQAGEGVEAGTAVLRLIQLDRLRVEGFIDAQLTLLPLVGRKVRIQFPNLPELAALSGVITFVSPEIDPVNHQVRIWAEFANPEHAIRSGLVATMTVTPDSTAISRQETPK